MRGLAALDITPPAEALEQLLRYSDALIAQNQVMNLTAITQPEDIARLHFLDSAALLKVAPMAGRRLIDVGTGAGFPGVVLKILCPALDLTLLDSLNKRLVWLASLCKDLGLTDINIHHGRAEELGHDPQLREQFDYATARAVAALPMLCELCLPFVKPGGQFLAMKAKDDEWPVSEQRLSPLGGCTGPSIAYTLPESQVSRCILILEKNQATAPDYPRKWSKIKQDESRRGSR